MWEIPSNKGKWHMRPASNILIFSLLQQQTLHSVQTNMMKHQLNVKQMKVLPIFLSTWFTDTVGWYNWKKLQLQQILKKYSVLSQRLLKHIPILTSTYQKLIKSGYSLSYAGKWGAGVDSCKHMIPEISDLTRHAQKHQRDDPQTWISEMERLEVPIVVATAHKSAAGVCVKCSHYSYFLRWASTTGSTCSARRRHCQLRVGAYGRVSYLSKVL